MKLHFKIPKKLKQYFETELQLANKALVDNQLETCWTHLERAHILGQAWPVEHTKAHWKMLQFAFRIKSSREIIGQMPRLLIGGIKSFVGKIPVGNSGGANVPPLKPMEIPPDLKSILNKFEN